MAKYTIELRELFENFKFNPPLYSREEVESFFKEYNLEDYLTQEQIDSINTAGLWSKDRLASEIVDYYYMREIGFETIGLFRHFAKTEMKLIMEEYLPLIYSSSIKYDPLVNVDFTESFKRNVKDDNYSTGNSNSNSNGISLMQDTPQGRVTKSDILDGKYTTSASGNEVSDSTSSSSRGNSNQDEEYVKTIKGNSGVSATAQKMVEQFRDNIRAINREIIERLNTLFMGLF